MKLTSTATWRCPLCPVTVQVEISTRTCLGHVHVEMTPAALADVAAHVWAQHPEAAPPATNGARL